MKADGMKFVMHENFLCDVTDYINTHPGGRIHIEESLGYDVSRCITGTTPINNNFLPYDHSYKARMHLMALVFAELVEEHGLILNNGKK